MNVGGGERNYDKIAKLYFEALDGRNLYRKKPPTHDILEFQRLINTYRENRVRHGQTVLTRTRDARYPQRRNVRRFMVPSVLELEASKNGQRVGIAYVLRRSQNAGDPPKYYKFWDVERNAPIFVRRGTMTMDWGPFVGATIRVHEHWTGSGLR